MAGGHGAFLGAMASGGGGVCRRGGFEAAPAPGRGLRPCGPLCGPQGRRAGAARPAGRRKRKGVFSAPGPGPSGGCAPAHPAAAGDGKCADRRQRKCSPRIPPPGGNSPTAPVIASCKRRGEAGSGGAAPRIPPPAAVAPRPRCPLPARGGADSGAAPRIPFPGGNGPTAPVPASCKRRGGADSGGAVLLHCAAFSLSLKAPLQGPAPLRLPRCALLRRLCAGGRRGLQARGWAFWYTSFSCRLATWV